MKKIYYYGIKIKMTLCPVRCFTCNKIIANKWEIYKKMTDEKIPSEKIFSVLGLRRYCCRRMILSHVDMIDKLLLYDQTKYTDS